MEVIPLFTKSEFIEFTVNLISSATTNIETVQRVNNEFTYKISMRDGRRSQITLKKLWEDYQQSNDINEIISFVNKNTERCESPLGITSEVYSISDFKENIFSVIQIKGFEDYNVLNQNDDNIFKQEIGNEMELLYLVKDNEGECIFVTTDMFNEEINELTIATISIENYRRNGWVVPTYSFSTSTDTFFIFEDKGNILTGQFLIKELTKKHIGDYFLFSSPSNKAFIICKPENKDVLSKGIDTLKEMTLSLMNDKGNKANSFIFEYDKGNINKLTT